MSDEQELRYILTRLRTGLHAIAPRNGTRMAVYTQVITAQNANAQADKAAGFRCRTKDHTVSELKRRVLYVMGRSSFYAGRRDRGYIL